MMQSIKNVFKIGCGPSSSHTMGPQFAAEIFRNHYPEASQYRISLFGSLAATGKGHLTDQAILNVLDPIPTEIVWCPEKVLPFHTNGMTFETTEQTTTQSWTVYSIGGGDLAEDASVKTEDSFLTKYRQPELSASIYPLRTMSDILAHCQKAGVTFWEYVQEIEGKSIVEFLGEVLAAMFDAVERGLDAEGVLPGGLFLQRKASSFFIKAKGYTDSLKSRALIYSYALAVAEENASGGIIVTAPTCGSCGVLPAVLYHLKHKHGFSEGKLLKALATAGLIANIVKANASVAGAEVGCQGEIGVACSMAAAAATQMFGGTIRQIEYAAEMGLEHHLGLTCDPIAGLVQIPCIERNAFAATRALDSCSYASLSDGQHLVSFDKVVQTMRQTGHDLPSLYKETSRGGLALGGIGS
jgi:L-serine dehydratase